VDFTAKHRFARISARKVRLVADLVRGKFVDDALDILRYQPQRGARLLEKVIKSALANAQDPEQNPGRVADVSNLLLTDVRIDGGPIIKRFMPRARGMACPILRRMSHISVTVSDT
jgi:large subunit ribosomal protein L22